MHILLCMLAYDVEWHMHEAGRPLLYSKDELAERATRRCARAAEPSDCAWREKATQREGSRQSEFELDAQPSAEQLRAVELLRESARNENQHRLWAPSVNSSQQHLIEDEGLVPKIPSDLQLSVACT